MSELGFRMDHEEPVRRRRVVSWLVSLLVLVVIGGAGIWLVLRTLAPTDDTGGQAAAGGTAVVEVSAGEPLGQIAESLRHAGVISDSATFVEAASRGRSIPPGRYTLGTGLDPESAYRLMLDPASRATSRVVIKEGMRLKEIVATASEVTGIPASEFRAALNRPETIGLPAAAGGNPEGWLFPATYDVTSDTTAVSLLSQMTARFQRTASNLNLESRARRLGLTPEQVVTVASILEVEVAPDDYGKAARVIYNRLKKGMKLQLDSTVNYALDSEKVDLSASDLAVDSPYNTYLVRGLPAGPLDSPGEAALEAALAPAKGDWIYFITTDLKNRTTRFTASEEEFLRWKREYQQSRGSTG